MTCIYLLANKRAASLLNYSVLICLCVSNEAITQFNFKKIKNHLPFSLTNVVCSLIEPCKICG